MRKHIMKYILAVAVLAFAISARAESFSDLVKRGNEAANTGDFQKALDLYHSAETERPESPELEYNMAGALYGAGKYEEAVDKYTKALNTDDIQQEASARYNLGNTYFRQGELEKAIGEYQKYLDVNPDDMDAKFNLELSRKLLKEQMKPQQQQQDEDKKQQQQKDSTQQQQQQQQQDQEEKKDSTQQQQQQDQNQDSTQQQQQPQPSDQQDGPQDMQQQQQPQEKEMSKEDAERILNAIRDDEQEVQKNLKKQKVRGNYRGKDW